MKRWLLPFLIAAAAAWAADTDAVLKKVESLRNDAAMIQSRIDALDDESRRLYDEYRRAAARTEALKSYNDSLEKLIASQEAEKQSLDRQIRGIEQTSQSVLPMMEKMVAALEQFVALDVPFLPDERRDRIDRLKTRLAQADVTVAEKYRLILEAYAIENEYGRTIEAYPGALPDGRQAEFLRLGRVGLYYLSLDGKEAGRFNPQTGHYDAMDSGKRGELVKALRMARKQSVPDLIALPLEAPRDAQ
ncbi:MAG: DUF3450 domain-containing protein [Campylobacterales bacterium]